MKKLVFMCLLCVLPILGRIVPNHDPDPVIAKLLDKAKKCPDKIPNVQFFNKWNIMSFDCSNGEPLLKTLCETMESWDICKKEQPVSIYSSNIERRMGGPEKERVEAICDVLVNTFPAKTTDETCASTCKAETDSYQLCNFYEAFDDTIRKAFATDVREDVTKLDTYFHNIKTLLPSVHGLFHGEEGMLIPCLDPATSPHTKPCKAVGEIMIKMVLGHIKFTDIGEVSNQNVTAACGELIEMTNKTNEDDPILSEGCPECKGEAEEICKVAALGIEYLKIKEKKPVEDDGGVKDTNDEHKASETAGESQGTSNANDVKPNKVIEKKPVEDDGGVKDTNDEHKASETAGESQGTSNANDVKPNKEKKPVEDDGGVKDTNDEHKTSETAGESQGTGNANDVKPNKVIEKKPVEDDGGVKDTNDEHKASETAGESQGTSNANDVKPNKVIEKKPDEDDGGVKDTNDEHKASETAGESQGTGNANDVKPNKVIEKKPVEDDGGVKDTNDEHKASETAGESQGTGNANDVKPNKEKKPVEDDGGVKDTNDEHKASETAGVSSSLRTSTTGATAAYSSSSSPDYESGNKPVEEDDGDKETNDEHETSETGGEGQGTGNANDVKPNKATLPIEDDETSTHFMSYFLVFIVLCIAGYILYHNKQKIIALVLEGKGGPGGNGRRPSTKQYKRLKTEDVMPSLEKSASRNTYVF